MHCILQCDMKYFAAAAAAAVIFVCTAFTSAIFTTEYARAEAGARYARATTRECYFYSSPQNSAALFAVPYTYCVEITGEDGDWYAATYAEDTGDFRAVRGYVKKSQFLPLDGTPEVVWLNKTVSITFSQETPPGNLPVIDDITLSAAFYGTFYSGGAGYSYVLCEDSFGYITGAIEDYPIIEEQKPQEDQPQQSPAPDGGAIVAFVAIALLVVLAAALLFLSGKKSKKRR